MKRVALFHAEWPVQSQTVNLARSLARAGIEVDLYVWNCMRSLAGAETLDAEARIVVHDLSLPRALRRWMDTPRQRNRLLTLEHWRDRFLCRGIPGSAVREAVEILRQRPAALCIGVEKRGLIWAGKAAAAAGLPLVYYSLELYDEAHPGTGAIAGFAGLRALERRYLAAARATIVQDEARAEHLARANGGAGGARILLPVAVAGVAMREEGAAARTALRRRLGITDPRPVLLYMGAISEERGCLEVAALARAHGERFAFAFHGMGEPAVLARLREAGAGRALLSTGLVPPEELAGLVAGADIGLVLYRDDCTNDRLTAFSSEKVALYCRAGVPFIAADNESYRGLVARFRCAELVSSPAQIPDAAERLLAERPARSAQAFAAFEAHYSHDAHAARLVRELEACA